MSKTGNVDELQRNWKSLLAKDANVATDTSPLVKSDEEWRRLLKPAEYTVLRCAGYEPRPARASRSRTG